MMRSDTMPVAISFAVTGVAATALVTLSLWHGPIGWLVGALAAFAIGDLVSAADRRSLPLA